MSSGKCNSITAKATGLFFSLFNVASFRDMPFGILQYVQCTHHGLTFVLHCVPFLFADSPKVPTFVNRNCHISVVSGLSAEALTLFFICSGPNIAENKA